MKQMDDAATVLRYFHARRSARNAYREYERESEAGRMSWPTFARRVRELEVAGRLTETTKGFLISHAVRDYAPIFNGLNKLFREEGDKTMDRSIFAWILKFSYESDRPQTVWKKLQRKCEENHLFEIMEFVRRMEENPEATLLAFKMQMELEGYSEQNIQRDIDNLNDIIVEEENKS